MSDTTEKVESNQPTMDDLLFGDYTSEQIREMAEKEANAGQPRDHKGRFVTAEEPTEAAETEESSVDPVEDTATKVPFRREIDLGDGSGKEVFEADTLEELLDKLATAKGNATKKIREQQAQLKELQEKKQAEQQQDKDDEFVLSQDMLSRPTDAVKKAFRKATGIDITEVKTLADRVKALTDAQNAQSELEAQNTAATAFIADHPEYVPSQANGKRLTRAVNLLVAEAKQSKQKIDYATLLSKAYEDLSESGLLELKSGDANDTSAASGTTTAQDRIGQRAGEGSQAQRIVRRSSSLAGRSRGGAPVKPEPTLDEMLSMDSDKLRELANKHMRAS